MTDKILCIGGAADGQRIDHRGRRDFAATEPRDPDAEMDMHSVIKYSHYRVERFWIGDSRTEISVAVEGNMSTEQAFRKLLDGYKP